MNGENSSGTVFVYGDGSRHISACPSRSMCRSPLTGSSAALFLALTGSGGPPSRLLCPTWETPSCCVPTEASCSPTSPWSTEMPSSESASFIQSFNGWRKVFVLVHRQNFSWWNQFKYWVHVYQNRCVHPAWQQSSSLYVLHFFLNDLFIWEGNIE